MTNPQIDYAALRAERNQLQDQIDDAPSWGAAISAMQERIDGINRTLAAMPKGE